MFRFRHTPIALSMALLGPALAKTPSAHAQMMNDGVWGSGWMGGYGGVWIPILIAIALVGAVAWVVKQKGK